MSSMCDKIVCLGKRQELEDKKAVFSEKEKNYLEHGLFITNDDLSRDKSA